MARAKDLYCQRGQILSWTQDTDTRRQSKDGTAVLYSFLLKLQFLALAGSTDHSGRSSACLESIGEGAILGIFDCMIL
jgi:hypothetical protein